MKGSGTERKHQTHFLISGLKRNTNMFFFGFWGWLWLRGGFPPVFSGGGGVCLLVCLFVPHLGQVEFARLGIKPAPLLQPAPKPAPQLQKHGILNPLHHKGTCGRSPFLLSFQTKFLYNLNSRVRSDNSLPTYELLQHKIFMKIYQDRSSRVWIN